MAITNPLSITYGDLTVGGDSQVFLIHNPYRLQKAYLSLRLSFEVVVVAESYEDLYDRCTELEDAFSARYKDLTITIDGNEWLYEYGVDLMNTVSTIAKSGNPETDRGFSRMYTIEVSGDLQTESGGGGLLHFDVNVSQGASRQKVVTFSGTFLPTEGSTAKDQYLSYFDSEASTQLSAIDSGATWELVDESYTFNRYQHTLQFTRQYIELLEDQSNSGRDDASITDHRITFTDFSQYPGDSRESIYRLHRVIARYDCAVNIDETSDDPKDVFEDKVLPHIKELFQSNFEPKVFCIEDKNATFDSTARRISASVQFLYQTRDGSEDVVEVTQSLAYRESRQIDYTPVHNQDEFAAEADPGFASRERIWRRVVTVIGDEQPRRRIGERSGSGPAGPFEKAIEGDEAKLDSAGGNGGVRGDGWNIISNESEVTDQWIGLPGEDEQLKLSTLVEVVVERWHSRPSGAGNRLGSRQ